MRQKINPEFDLATIPPRRRRQFIQHRFNYTRRADRPEILNEFNGYKTVFGVIGESSRYRFTSDFSQPDAMARNLLSSSCLFEFVEMYALDLFQHWHLDNPDEMRDALLKTDRFVAKLQEGCSLSDYTLVVMSDHGQEPVIGTIPLLQALRRSGVKRDT